MQCANCGTEIQAGSKFCQECGTPVPQVKYCISCGFELPLSSKFCPECGAKQIVGDGDDLSTSGLNMGDKNVIAGDVVSNVTNNTQVHHNETITSTVTNNTTNNVSNNTTNTTNNTTNIYHQDDTKKVVVCESCGKSILLTESYKCNKCGKVICKDCFDIDASLCYLCSPSQKVNKTTDKEVLEFINKIMDINDKINSISANTFDCDVSSIGAFGKSILKGMGNAITTGSDVFKLVNEKETLINAFTPPRTKRAYSDTILFMEVQRDMNDNRGQTIRDFHRVWSSKLINLINQAQVLFGDDEVFMETLQKHAKMATADCKNTKTSLADFMQDNMLGGKKLNASSIMSFFGKDDKEKSDSLTCSNCGAEIANGKKFCTKCGTKL